MLVPFPTIFVLSECCKMTSATMRTKIRNFGECAKTDKRRITLPRNASKIKLCSIIKHKEDLGDFENVVLEV